MTYQVVTGNRGRPETAIQVCMSLADPATRRREIEALIGTAAYFGTARNFVITMDEEEAVRERGVKISIVPAWKWFLSDFPA